MVVVDVDYRLSPEVEFPTALYDSWTAVKWVRFTYPNIRVLRIHWLKVMANAETLNINPKSVSIGGLSAGGQMTAVMCHFAREEGIDLKLQLMTVAATDFRQFPENGKEIDPSCPYDSFVTYKDVPWGPMSRVQWFMDHWLGTDIGKLKVLFRRCEVDLSAL